MTKGLLLIGAGGHARSCIDVIESAGMPIRGLVDKTERIGQSVLGYAILGTDDELERLLLESSGALVTVGQIESAALRIALYGRLEALGARRPVIVAKSATVSPHAQIGAGTIIMHGAIVNAAARIGENVIVNSRALIEHDCVVEDHCHVSTGAVANGAVKIGRGSFIGSGSMIREGVTIGAGSLIGAGSVVLGDCPENTDARRGVWPRRSS